MIVSLPHTLHLQTCPSVSMNEATADLLVLFMPTSSHKEWPEEGVHSLYLWVSVGRHVYQEIVYFLGVDIHDRDLKWTSLQLLTLLEARNRRKLMEFKTRNINK